MIEQRVDGPSLKGWRGVALIAALALLVILLSRLFEWLSRWLGGASSLLFLASGAALAWFMMHRFVMGFVYTCDGSCLRVSRVYGKRRLLAQEIWLSTIRACGDPEKLRARFPGARVRWAVRPECPLEPLAIAYGDGGKTSILLLQPDERLQALLTEAARK